jgi:hypothetical protein
MQRRPIRDRLGGRCRDFRSGGKALAAARAAGRDNTPTADSFHAGAEAMAALAHDFRRLICPFHVSNSISTDAACFATGWVEADIVIEKA